MNEHDTLYFENYKAFSAANNTLKSQDVEADCFYNLLLRMEQADLNQNFGWSFMEDDRWLENYVSWIQYEEYFNWPRQSYNLGVYMPQKHHFGFAERQASFSLPETQDGEPYRMYAVDLFPH